MAAVMSEDNLVKLAVVRYALLPRQLLSFDYAYAKDCYEFEKYFSTAIESCLTQAHVFLGKLESGIADASYVDKCESIVAFVRTLPFVDASEFTDLAEHNPFDDADGDELDSYLMGQHIPPQYAVNQDEASIFYAGSPKTYYEWYNDIEDKTLPGMLRLYIGLLHAIRNGKLVR